MKALFIFPPFWSVFSISTGIPQIMGFLENNGYKNIKALDLNAKFSKFIYHPKNLKDVLNNLLTQNIDLTEEDKNKIQFIYKHIKYMNNLYTSKKKWNKYFIDRIKIFEIVNELINKDKKNISAKIKVLVKFYSTILDDIMTEKYDYIGFSVNCNEQSFASRILIKMLREKGYNGFINIGGTNVSTSQISLIKNPTLFKKYINSAMFGTGELSTKELFEFIEGKRKIEEVSNLIYLNSNNKIQKNPSNDYISNEFITSIYTGFNFEDYLIPENIFPIRTSTGCYWGKCTFCNYNLITPYNQKNVDFVISEIKNLINKYKINNFYFVDAALSPSFLDEFSTKIIKNNIKIYYITNLRFEKQYTPQFLKKLFQSGLRCAMWGFESASPRILNLMNKGTSIEETENILQHSKFLGIFNHLYYIYGFPTETSNDFKMTYDFIKRNINYIDSVSGHGFSLLKNTNIYNNLLNFGIKKTNIVKKLKSEDEQFVSFDKLGMNMNIEFYNKINEKIDNLLSKKNRGKQLPIEYFLFLGKYSTNK